MSGIYRVLVVEDDPALRQTLIMALHQGGFVTVEAENGLEALRLFSTDAFDAVLMDGYMPEMNGFDTCRKLRRLPGGEHIPIVFITGSEESGVINEAFECGATDFLRKPIVLAGLNQRLLRLIAASKGQTALRQAQALVNTMSDMAFWLNEQGRIAFANPAAYLRLGYVKCELGGVDFWSFCESIRPDLHKNSTLQSELHRDGSLQTEVILQARDGRAFTGELVATVVKEFEHAEYCVIVRDISELRARQAELQAVADHAPDLILRLDREGRILFVNRACERFTGLSSVKLRNRLLQETGLPEIVARTLGERLIEVLASGNSNGFILDYPLANTIRNLEVIAAPERTLRGRVETVIFFFSDVTDHKRIESERIIADRMHTMGVLAGGVAHDFNNIVTALMNLNALALLELPAEHPAAKLLREGQPAMDQAVKLAQQLLTFAKGGAPIKKVTDFGKLVRETASFTARGIRSAVTCAIPGSLWLAEVDEGQMNQVLTNLIINADQAMCEGGTIRLSLEAVVMTDGNTRNLAAGPYIKLEIADTGVGIAPKILNRVFEPYFTTKKDGSGLGLTTALSVILRHGGQMEIDSTEGQGTTVRCYLPANPSARLLPEVAQQTKITRSGRILILEDHEMIAKGYQQLLGKAGHQVTLTTRGEDTIAAYSQGQAEGAPYDLLILDLTVPGGFGGLEVITLLKKQHPGVRAIVSSGYSDAPVMAEPARHGFAGVLRKPFTRDRLLQTVSDVLGTRGS
ncbi:MAG: response regulator [Verrucomicrobiota bacterium]|nr:response regulator [Verrucomicrobiota bacterium]